MSTLLHTKSVISLQEIKAISLNDDWAVGVGWCVDFGPLNGVFSDDTKGQDIQPVSTRVCANLFGQRLAMSIFGLGACYG